MLTNDPTRNALRHRIAVLGGDGILTEMDALELSIGVLRVLSYMLDYEWHTARQIRIAASPDNYEASEGLRRMREIRAIKGLDIERRRVEGTRLFEYRLLSIAMERWTQHSLAWDEVQ